MIANSSLLIIAATISLLCPTSANGRDMDYRSGPVLLFKGTGYFIHALPSSLPVTREKSPLEGFSGELSWFPNGMAVLHTSVESGTMKPLITSGRYSYPGLPMGLDRIYYGRSRIVGITADAQRLYLVQWHAEVEVPALPGVQPPKDFGKGAYRLIVFNLADGKKIHESDLKDKIPSEPLEETTGKGPLRLHANGVSCFGIVFEFKGQELKKKATEKPDGRK